MHNAYFSSTIYAVRCKESFTLSFNGYSKLCYERYDRTPSHCSSCCGCCDCCELSLYRVPIKPILLNGLRQSTLLQLSTSRRFILGRDQYFSRLPAYGLHRGCFDLDCFDNERNDCNRSRRRIEGRCVCAGAASQKGRGNYHSFGSDEAEAVLSLLTEESDKDATGTNWKNVSSSKRMGAEKKRKNLSRERNLSLSKNAEPEKKGNLKQHETSTIKLRREDGKPSREREDRKRRDVSSCSSYYSLSSGDFGSDMEVQDRRGLEELSAGYEKDEANHGERQVKEEINKHKHVSEKLQNVSKQEKTVFGADIDWNLRKKSEKKLAEVNVEETQSEKEHQEIYSRAFKTHEASHGKPYLSQKQVNSEEDDSSFFKDQTDYVQTRNKKHLYTDVQDSSVDEVEKALLSRKAFTGRQGKLELSDTLLKESSDEHRKLVSSTSTTGKETLKSKKALRGRQGNLEIPEMHLQETSDEHKSYSGSTSITGKDMMNISSQKYIRNSQIEDSKRTSNALMKNLGAKQVSVVSSVQAVEEQQHQQGEKMLLKREAMNQTKERRRSQQFYEASLVHQSNVEDTSLIKSRTKMKNTDDNLNLSSDTRATWQQTDKRTAQSSILEKGSELVTSSSLGYTSDEKQMSSSSKRTSEKVRSIPKSKSTEVNKTRESSSQTDERIVNFEFAYEDRKTSHTSISEETASREEYRFQGSLTSVSQAGKHIKLAENDERSSAVMLIPPSSQSLGGGSAHVKLTAGVVRPGIILETSESDSSAMFDNFEKRPTLLSVQYSKDGIDQGYSEPSNIKAPEDSLGSVDRVAKSSKQFVERVRHEVTTSEAQMTEVSRTKSAFEDEKQFYSSRKQGTQNDSQLKENDSSHSAGLNGSKGPTDEMWDVTEPSVDQSQIADESEISMETGKTIASRTGKSLWNMIADVVRLRWATRAGSSTSGERSGKRNSPNKSDSETWFSGQEHDETRKSNVIKETSSLQQAMTSDEFKQGKHDTQSEREISEAKKVKDKGKRPEVDEFVERDGHEVTTSETQEMEVIGTKLAFEDERHQIYNSRKQGNQNDSQSKEHDSTCSSGLRGSKAHSDEMSDVAEPSVQQSLIAEESEIGMETGKMVANRTGRFLWNMIANVVRLRWASRAGSSTSTERSGERNSPNKSDSEAWFSGQEHEETRKSYAIKETRLLSQATRSDKLRRTEHHTHIKGKKSNTKRIKDRGKHIDVGSSSPNTLGSGPVVSSYISEEANLGWTEGGKYLKVNTSGMKNMELPIALPASTPPVVGKIAQIGGLDLSTTEPVESIKGGPVAPVLSELSDSGIKDGELKQRKFQRTSQVVRDRFDEWEEAYKLELEQRTMDELFMKEALLEAQKAADNWEVPVGAVLVQNGEIIARGCNLVEQLRDSTAHAEMICIREASNLLRSWRLSDSTLYVTLEPCPMCAGAILQARIDTVVWGAPNKLLGADGSWIRLFPEGGENDSESSSALPPAPVHPFHPKMKIRRGVLANECADIMQQFFQLRRRKKKQESPTDSSRLSVAHHHHSKLMNKIHDIFHVMFCL